MVVLFLACNFLLYCCKTYHGDRVDRVHDGEQQDVVLRKVPIAMTHEYMDKR